MTGEAFGSTQHKGQQRSANGQHWVLYRTSRARYNQVAMSSTMPLRRSGPAPFALAPRVVRAGDYSPCCFTSRRPQSYRPTFIARHGPARLATSCIRRQTTGATQLHLPYSKADPFRESAAHESQAAQAIGQERIRRSGVLAGKNFVIEKY
jgi:hypothetical protein